MANRRRLNFLIATRKKYILDASKKKEMFEKVEEAWDIEELVQPNGPIFGVESTYILPNILNLDFDEFSNFTIYPGSIPIFGNEKNLDLAFSCKTNSKFGFLKDYFITQSTWRRHSMSNALSTHLSHRANCEGGFVLMCTICDLEEGYNKLKFTVHTENATLFSFSIAIRYYPTLNMPNLVVKKTLKPTIVNISRLDLVSRAGSHVKHYSISPNTCDFPTIYFQFNASLDISMEFFHQFPEILPVLFTVKIWHCDDDEKTSYQSVLFPVHSTMLALRTQRIAIPPTCWNRGEKYLQISLSTFQEICLFNSIFSIETGTLNRTK